MLGFNSVNGHLCFDNIPRYIFLKQYSIYWVSLVAQMEESACNAGDLSLILGLGICWRGNGYSLQYSGLDRGAWWTMGSQIVGHD